MVGKVTEQAELRVNGQKFRDWESVMVRHALREVPPYRFRFTCSEGMPIASNFAKLQIKPGDKCEVYLAGIKAISGKVSTRQVYYDKRRHYIEIQGATFTLDLTGSSPITKTMEHKDVTFEQLARSLLKPFNIPFKVEGGQLSQLKFPRVSLMHGLSVLDHLDLYSRAVGASFTSDADGAFVAVVGPSQSGGGGGAAEGGGSGAGGGSGGGAGGVERDAEGRIIVRPSVGPAAAPATAAPATATAAASDSVVEGQNILIGREIIYNASMESSMPAISHQTGNDKKWGAEVSHVPYLSKQQQTFSKAFMPFVIPSELPTADTKHLEGRASTEGNWLAEDAITVFATVYGWLRPSGGLWYRDQKVHVKSPMLMMDQDLVAKSVTFTQDSTEGTRTTLELCNPLALGGMVPELKQ